MTRPRSLALGIRCLATLVVVATLGVQRPLEAQTRSCENAAPPAVSDSSSLEDLVAALAKATACLSGHPGQAKDDRLLLLRTLTELAGCGVVDVSKLDSESALRSALAHCDAANGPRLSDSDLARIRASLAAAGDPDPDATLATLARIAAGKLNVFDSIK